MMKFKQCHIGSPFTLLSKQHKELSYKLEEDSN